MSDTLVSRTSRNASFRCSGLKFVVSSFRQQVLVGHCCNGPPVMRFELGYKVFENSSTHLSVFCNPI